MRDLVMLVVSSPAVNVIQHLDTGSAHLYFVIAGTLREMFIYFVKTGEEVEGSFIVYNTYTGEIGYSDRLRIEPNLTSIPIVEIENQNLLPDDLLSEVEGL
ncbi:MAG: hypothetical protein AYL28_003440 [Candidatus Bathyarchaeota archaeon B23]|nr:MAG: hypothetical protein AYL28_003440 [Candidatus Bathyarchaeota archaeon B23]